MQRKMSIYVLLICCLVIVYYSKLLIKPKKTVQSDQRDSSFRAAIVTLTRGEPTRLLNMLHSIEYFYPQSINKYPVIIFYDSHGTNIRRSIIKNIKSCVKLNVTFQDITLFSLIENPSETIDTINRESSTVNQIPIGLRFASKFWSHTIFHHPLINNNYDYIMRLDDDSYFSEPLPYDLFDYAHRNNLDYIYRALILDTRMAGPDYLLPQYLRSYYVNCISNCFPFHSYNSVYSNFFLTRVQFWHQKQIEELTKEILSDDNIFIHSLGDGNIHAVILALLSDTKRSQAVTFAYGHNTHIFKNGKTQFDTGHYYYNWFEVLRHHHVRSCQELVIIDPNTKQLKYILIQ